ncbi:MAG TPA: hypothetical protein VNX68_12720, partial [Nitrosopumilaceae archaeon]|nr:hypothetical protein [Nitrosopumilaceae archaeon]
MPSKFNPLIFQKDPIAFQKFFWPHVTFYKEQRKVLQSLVENDETLVPAGNMLGKDFTAGFVALWFFMTRHPVRIMTTSATDSHLDVLWGEIGRFITSSKIPLEYKEGGPLIVNHRHIRKIVCGSKCDLSQLKGIVAASDNMAALQGYHIANMGDGCPRTLFIADEASAVPDEYYRMSSTWANRMLIIGNPWPCTNFFFRHVEEGDKENKNKEGSYYRKIIKIKATDSPNVRLALLQIERGEKPTGEILVPGVKSYEEYTKNIELWDDYQKSVSLEEEFYKGAEIYLYPSKWLDLAHKAAFKLSPRRRGKA